MFFGNEWLAHFYLRKPDAALSVRAMAPAILLVCLVSAYRGYCQGNGNMIPTTVDEVRPWTRCSRSSSRSSPAC